MQQRMLAGVITGALALGIISYWLSADASSAVVASSGMIAEASPVVAGTAGPVAPAAIVTGLESLPPSLRGNVLEGELEVDAAGRLRITAGLRRLFDHFLSAVGEEPLETILARIRAYIRHQLPVGAAAEAGQLLDSYLAYKRGLDAIPQAPSAGGQPDVDALRRQLQQVQALRSQFFTQEVIAAFFGDEDAYDRYTLERIILLQNTALSSAQRAARLVGLEQQLPAELRESLRVVNQVQNLEAMTRDWQRQGGRPAELRQIRESLVGAGAADRLEALDRESAQWEERVNSWHAERTAILANRGLSEADRQAQLGALRDSRFSESERLRVLALERLRDRGEG